MKKNLCLTFYLTLLMQMSSKTLFAQCSMFYRTYQYGLEARGKDIVELPDSSYIITGSIRLVSPPGLKPFALRINNCGDTIWTNYFLTNKLEIGNCEKFNLDKVIVFSVMKDTSSLSNSTYNFLDIDSGYLCCLNSFITASNGGKFQQVKRTNSGKYACTIDPFYDPLHAITIADSNLNFLHSSPMPTCCTIVPIEDNDGNFYVCATSYGPLPYYYVVKYDSSLNQQWLLNTGTADSGNPTWGYITTGIVFASDSNLIVSTDGPDWQMMKVDRFTGDTLWTKYYTDTIPGNSPWKEIGLLTRTINGINVAYTYHGEFLFIDDNSNLLYAAPIKVYSLKSMEPTSDGGIIAVGTDYKQGVYVIKVVKLDSLGNTVFTSEIELGNNQKQELNIYPNPASDAVTFEIDNLNKTGSLSCSLYNIQGKACRQFEIINSTHTIDVSAMPSGLYLLKATNENVSYNKLFMVSH